MTFSTDLIDSKHIEDVSDTVGEGTACSSLLEFLEGVVFVDDTLIIEAGLAIAIKGEQRDTLIEYTELGETDGGDFDKERCEDDADEDVDEEDDEEDEKDDESEDIFEAKLNCALF